MKQLKRPCRGCGRGHQAPHGTFMPIECLLLKDKPAPFERCPLCGAEPFVPFLRGMIQRGRRRFIVGQVQPHCCVICSCCKEVIGYEAP